MKSLELLQILTEFAKKYRKDAQVSIARNSHMNEVDANKVIDQKDIDAVLVDFINYIGTKQCIDLGLYSKDLND